MDDIKWILVDAQCVKETAMYSTILNRVLSNEHSPMASSKMLKKQMWLN